MTMTTSVRINAPINPHRLLDKLTELVGGDPKVVPREERDHHSYEGVRWLSNPMGYGLMALCDVEWHPDGPLPTRTKWHDDDEADWPAALVECSFDTTYSFKVNDAGCGDLYAWMLVELRSWLAEQGITDAYWFAGEYVSSFQPLSDLSQHKGNPELGARAA